MSIRSKISVIPSDPEAPRHRGALFVEGVPDDTKNAFKAACARRGKTMRDVLITLMREFAERVEMNRR